jgi:hypothetical protein
MSVAVHRGNAQRLLESANKRFLVGRLGSDGSWPRVTENLPCSGEGGIYILCLRARGASWSSPHKRHYDNPAEVKNKLSFQCSKIFVSRRDFVLRSKRSARWQYLIGCVFTKHMAAQAIDGYGDDARLEIRGAQSDR